MANIADIIAGLKELDARRPPGPGMIAENADGEYLLALDAAGDRLSPELHAHIDAFLATPEPAAEVTEAMVAQFDKIQQECWDNWCESDTTDERDPDQVRLDSIRAGLKAAMKAVGE